ncbi:MAG: type II toxin-antitoxin system Phd/YefM family antitoxin [Flavobacterium sp.]|nr:MAG: type II toxin-antitoxin system Phd/YefM family antitoxin [Flavobacterium sp.]
MTTLSSRDFNHNVSKAKSLSRNEPVFITDRGIPSHVLLSYQQYELLLKKTLSNADRLGMSQQDLAKIDDDFEFERAHFIERQVEF